MKKLIIVSTLIASLNGCAALSLAPKAVPYIDLAQTLLHQLGNYYDKLVDLKSVPDKTADATKALAVADATAEVLKQILAGQVVIDDTKANVLAGQVAGVTAMTKNLEQ